ncbi:MAG: TolC family protein [Bdellovibrionales bacterium]
MRTYLQVYIFSIWAASAISQPIRLEKLLSQLRSQNPAIRASRFRRDAKTKIYTQVTALPDPRLQTTFLLEPVETRTGPQRASLGLSQTFPSKQKLRLRGAIANMGVRLAEQSIQGIVLTSETRLKKAFYRYWYARRAKHITQEMIDLLIGGEQVALARYAAGQDTQGVALKAQVELGILKDRMQSFEEMAPIYREEILALLGDSEDVKLGEPTLNDLQEQSLIYSLNDLYALSSKRSPHINETLIHAQQKKLEADLALKEKIPDLTVGISTIFTDHSRFQSVNGSGHNPVSLSVGINLPLRRSRYRAAAQEKNIKSKALRETAIGQTHDNRSLIRKYYFAYKDARRKISLYRNDLLPKIRQTLKVKFTSFQSDRVTFLDLLDSERSLFDFEIGYAQSLMNHLEAIAELERLVAGSVAREVVP